jgi:hypothetical protein
LISSSLAKRTWQKYSSALALWEKFAKNEKVKGFPALGFVCWCSKNTTINTTTVKGYLTALRKIKFLLGFRSKKGSKEMEKIILRGMENIEGIKAKPSQKVTPVDLKILSSIKRGLKKKFWKKCTKKSVWTLNVIAFWGLLRLGEVLPGKARSFDKTSVLLWKDVKFSKDKAILNLRQPKTRSPQSKTVVLYKLSAKQFCPVRQLRQLKKLQEKMGIWDKDLPIFLRASGESLTKSTFLKKTNAALRKLEPAAQKIQGKSYRSGIPTLLKKSESEDLERHLKTLGRWKSSAYRCYIRNSDPGDRIVFLQTAEALLKNLFVQERKPESGSA